MFFKILGALGLRGLALQGWETNRENPCPLFPRGLTSKIQGEITPCPFPVGGSFCLQLHQDRSGVLAASPGQKLANPGEEIQNDQKRQVPEMGACPGPGRRSEGFPMGVLELRGREEGGDASGKFLQVHLKWSWLQITWWYLLTC